MRKNFIYVSALLTVLLVLSTTVSPAQATAPAPYNKVGVKIGDTVTYTLEATN